MGWKVVINPCYGGFSLSERAMDRLRELKGVEKDNYIFLYDLPRHDKDLVKVVEELGELADGCCAELKVVELDFPAYYIEEYDGLEIIHTPSASTYIYIEDTPELENK